MTGDIRGIERFYEREIWYRNEQAIAMKVGRLNYTLPLALVPLLPAFPKLSMVTALRTRLWPHNC